MKKLICLFVSFSATVALAQTQLWWSTNDGNPGTMDGTPDLVDTDGSTVMQSDNYIMHMYTTGDAMMNPFGMGTDDMQVAGASVTAGTASGGPFPGGMFVVLPDYGPGGLNIAGLDVFTVIFNASTIGAATHYAVVDDTPFTVPTIGAPPATKEDYIAGDIVVADWQLIVVPEPSTYAMILCGVGLLAFRRYRRS